jgi:hypothetical protein
MKFILNWIKSFFVKKKKEPSFSENQLIADIQLRMFANNEPFISNEESK